jgi:hypothetical protein
MGLKRKALNSVNVTAQDYGLFQNRVFFVDALRAVASSGSAG